MGQLRVQLDEIRKKLGEEGFRKKQTNIRITVLAREQAALIAKLRHTDVSEILRDGLEIGIEVHIAKAEGDRVAVINKHGKIIKEFLYKSGS